MKIEFFIKRFKKDYRYRTFVTGCFSLFVTFCFALYNGSLFLIYSSVWNGSIGIYYFLLALIRLPILLVERDKKNENDKRVFNVFLITSILIFVLNLSLTVPISLMVLNQKEVVIQGIIPAIAMATYTTYKVAISSINFTKTRKSNYLLIRELRLINFIDALVSILTLQNTLLVVLGSANEQDMLILSAVSSAVILLAVIIISILFFINVLKIRKSKKKNAAE